MAQIELKKINKIYPNGVQAVFDFDLKIETGEFIVLVGPSGCGKSTTLRMIAGLEDITNGDFLIDGRRVNDIAPKDRDIAMVFQNYALYAHMSVYHNMAFSLVLRKVDSNIIHEKVMEAAKILGLTPYLNRRPKALSGGQRQRVAVGRSIVREPKVFLFDEPLSNLDAKLRNTMRKELIELHKKLRVTMVYVTHDQIEALTLADRIVVMKDGYIQQVGTPKEIYDYPENMFVAGFIGTPPMNFIEGIYQQQMLIIGDNQISCDYPLLVDQQKVFLGARPEFINVYKEEVANSIKCQVELYELLGATSLVHVYINQKLVIAKVDSSFVVDTADTVYITFEMSMMHYFDFQTKQRLYLRGDDCEK